MIELSVAGKIQPDVQLNWKQDVKTGWREQSYRKKMLVACNVRYLIDNFFLQ